MYDTIIIGAGPAGYTAGIYAARREMKALIIGKESGGQLVWAADIENYPGFSQISNTDLIKNMEDHVKGLGVEIKTGITFGEDITLKSLKDDGFRAFFMATGLHRSRALNVKGEDLPDVRFPVHSGGHLARNGPWLDECEPGGPRDQDRVPVGAPEGGADREGGPVACGSTGCADPVDRLAGRVP